MPFGGVLTDRARLVSCATLGAMALATARAIRASHQIWRSQASSLCILPRFGGWHEWRPASPSLTGEGIASAATERRRDDGP